MENFKWIFSRIQHFKWTSEHLNIQISKYVNTYLLFIKREFFKILWKSAVSNKKNWMFLSIWWKILEYIQKFEYIQNVLYWTNTFIFISIFKQEFLNKYICIQYWKKSEVLTGNNSTYGKIMSIWHLTAWNRWAAKIILWKS